MPAAIASSAEESAAELTGMGPELLMNTADVPGELALLSEDRRTLITREAL